MDTPLLRQIVNRYAVEVCYDEDIDLHTHLELFEWSPRDKKAYLNLFTTGELALYVVNTYELCSCCNNNLGVIDSLGAIEAKSAQEALEYYITNYLSYQMEA